MSTRSRRRHRRPNRSGATFLAVGTAAVVVAALLGGFAVAATQPEPIFVEVGGRPVRVADRRPTVAGALRAAGIKPRDGTLFSVASHRRLDAHAFPAQVFVNGRPGQAKSTLHPHDRVELINGRDEVEPVDQRQIAAMPAGLPEIEEHLWHPGRPGIDDVQVGRVSGEVTARVPRSGGAPPAEEAGMTVALSFDDGPDPTWTPQVLQILREENVHAMFCEVGTMVVKHPELAQAVAQAGHTLCDHTMHHVVHLERKSPDEIAQEIGQGFDTIHTATGIEPGIYRPPGGTLSPEVVEAAHRRGLRVVRWTVDPADYRRPPAATILTRVLNTVRPGAVILMHDGGGDRSQTVGALRRLIAELRARGYGFATPAT